LNLRSGKKKEGEWKNGQLWNGIIYDENGNIQYKLVNGIKYVGEWKGKMGKNMVKGHTITLVEGSMWGNSRKGKLGLEYFTTKTETSHSRE
jgi:hypothetical protein